MIMEEFIHTPIGGYFELELPSYPEFHANAIALNSGRFCLEYILRCRNFKLIYIPYFTCESAIEPILKLGIDYRFYHIDKNYHIVDNIQLFDDEAIIYTNYWGLYSAYCEQLASKYGNSLILDYTQAFFSKPLLGIDTYYSCRKFFGVPDGGYLYSNAKADFEIEQDISYQRMDSLTKRIDISPEVGYDDFKKIGALFHDLPIRKMSKLTKRLMNSINYDLVAQKRIDNYNMLRTHLGGKALEPDEVPMIFPFESTLGQELRKILISNKVFVAKYWPNVDLWANPNSNEFWLANHIIPLPIDQRYDLADMKTIIDIICKYLFAH